MNDLRDSSPVASPKVATFLQSIITCTGLNLGFDISESGQAPAPAPASSRLNVQFTGPDTGFLTARHGELLHSLEHLTAQLLRLAPEEHDRISFDADNFKRNRDLELRRSAEAAIKSVQTTGRPYAFPPMNSRERRMLHLVLSESGLPTASSGENPRRYVILYPEGQAPGEGQAVSLRQQNTQQNVADAEKRANAIRMRFRSR
jgi:spoIIIJ-associated protein